MIVPATDFTFAAYQAGEYGEHVIVHGDCLEVMAKIPDKCVDLVLTDPPYGTGGRDGSVHLNDDSITGNRMSSDAYVWLVRTYSRLIFYRTVASAHCYIFSDWRRFKDVQIAFESGGWELRSLIVWDKGNGMGQYWRSCHEFILWFTKRKPRALSHGGCFNVLHYPPVKGQRNHPAEKPIDLVNFLIEASTRIGDLILDPFLGSGTTLVAAKQLGRRGIGIEIERKYCEIAEDRLRQEVLKL
jgi:site-specific DNA-methyltransferase (adenine-specific)